MKKLSLLIGGLLFSGLIMAQAGDVKGTITLEGQTNIGGVVIGQKLSPSLRFRYFASEKIALRATFGMFNRTVTDKFYASESDNTGAEGTYTDKRTTYNIAIGAEFHVEGTEKVSPYFAVDFMYGGGKAIIDGVNSNGSSYVADYSRDAELPLKRFGGALMGGLDYNFSSAFYLGGEVGVAISSLTAGPGETEVTSGTSTTMTKSNEKKYGTATDLIAAIRLGFRF